MGGGGLEGNRRGSDHPKTGQKGITTRGSSIDLGTGKKMGPHGVEVPTDPKGNPMHFGEEASSIQPTETG